MKGFLCNKGEIIQAKERFRKVNYVVGVLICNSVQLKKKENTFLKKQEKKKPGKPGKPGCVHQASN